MCRNARSRKFGLNDVADRKMNGAATNVKESCVLWDLIGLMKVSLS